MNKLLSLALGLILCSSTQAQANVLSYEASIHYAYTINYTAFFDLYIEFLDEHRDVVPLFNEDTLELHFIGWLAARIDQDAIIRHGWKIDVRPELQ